MTPPYMDAQWLASSWVHIGVAAIRPQHTRMGGGWGLRRPPGGPFEFCPLSRSLLLTMSLSLESTVQFSQSLVLLELDVW